MANEINKGDVTKLARIVKQHPGESERFYSEKSGIAMSQILRHLVLAEIEADPSLKIKATGPNIEKARNQGVRWPRIAARTGLSVTEAQKMYETHTGKPANEGRVTKSASGKAASGRRGAAASTKQATSGRRGAAAKAATTSGRRGAAAGKPAAGRRGTRAAAKAGSPK